MASHESFHADDIRSSGLPGKQQGEAQEAEPAPAAPVAPPLDRAKSNKVRLAPGTQLSGGRYKTEKLLAAGGMGAVYRAIDTRFNRPCAVKEMLDTFQSEMERQQSLEWFEREATLLLDLHHPCIPRVRDFFAEDGKQYLVMDLIDGRTLAEVVEREGTVQGAHGAHGVSEARARSWAQQLCSVLDYLHSQKPPIIFRDLKPLNIMVTVDEKIKLIDFGIARTFQAQAQSTIIMTVGYAPPEQLTGRPEPRSDLYALGATLHKVLTCHDAANNKPGIFNFPPLRTLRPDLTPAFEQVVMKALDPMLERRWFSAVEMEHALTKLPPVSAMPTMTTGIQQDRQPSASFQTTGGSTDASGQSFTPSTTGSRIAGVQSGGTQTSPQAAPGATGPAQAHLTAAFGHLAATPARVDAAFEAANLAYRLEPQNPLVHRLFGQIFARRVPPQPDLALHAYSRSLQLNPHDAETHKLMGDVILYLRQQPLQAIPSYIQALRLKPNDYESHWRLGQCYEKSNQLDSALRAYLEAAHLAPKQSGMAKIHVTSGQLALRLKQFLVAEKAFIQALTLNPGDDQTRFLLCQAYEQQGKFEAALHECNYLLQSPSALNPTVQQTHQRLRARLRH